MPRYIDADALIDDLMERYCKECNKRKGIKNGKYRIIYEIGEAPCRACEVDDVKAELEGAPTVDVPDTNVGDTISRQTAIDALWKALFEYEDKTEKQFQESEDLDVADWFQHRLFVQNMNDIDRQTILNLPPAAPDLSGYSDKLWKAAYERGKAEAEQRWIPVTERPPEAGVRYQVTFESGEVGYADFRNKIFSWDGSVKENVWEIERYYEDDGEVIAWKPLPKPYERSEE